MRISELRFSAALVCLLFVCCCLTGCGRDLQKKEEPQTADVYAPITEESITQMSTALLTRENGVIKEEEFRGVWMTFSEIGKTFTYDADVFYQRLFAGFSALSEKGFNTVIFHVRAFSDAFYASSYFPWSSYLTGTQGVSPGFDPLAVAVRAAHDAQLKIHAWINPYRVSYQNDFSLLSEDNPAKIMHTGGQSENLLITESGIYYNPASVEMQKLIIDGIREIVGNYDVDGIHIDDYFYPSDVGSCDSASYFAYTASGGTLGVEAWRMVNVNTLVAGIYSAVKSIAPTVQFGISPGGIRSYNYETCYADTELWCKEPGYCDYIVPQIYFGFQNNYAFDALLDYWSGVCSDHIALYVGLALYKSGVRDSYAGSEDAALEWMTNSDLITKQLLLLRQNDVCRGFVVFSYSDFFDTENTIKAAEVSGIYELLDEE